MQDDGQKTGLALKANSMVNELRNGKYLYEQFTETHEKRYKIAGKTMREWKEHFHLSIDPDMTPRECIRLDIKLIEMYEEASFLKNMAQAAMNNFKSTSQDHFRAVYANLVGEYRSEGKKLPAKDTLTVLADQEIKDEKQGLVHFETVLDFWKDILGQLNFYRKMIENSTFNLNIEARAIDNEKYRSGLEKSKDR